MRNCDIAKIAGLSNASVYKILYLKDRSKYKFKPETIEKVRWLKAINYFLEAKFKDQLFIELCDLVIERTSKRDSKKYMEIIELANSCKMLSGKVNHGIVKTIYYTAYDIFIDSDFCDLCNIGIIKSKNGKLRELGFELRELSKTFRKKLNLK